METRFSFDKLDDSLIISNKEDKERVKNNFMIDNFVISLTGSGKIVGLEIREVSSFLKEIGMDISLLENIDRVSLIVTPKRDSIFIGFILETPNFGSKLIPITHVPIEAIKN